MTFIQPNKHKGLFNIVLAALAVAVVFGTFGMIALYNETVNLTHNITAAQNELNSIGATSTVLNNEIISALGRGSIAGLAANAGLVMESKPQYFPAGQANASNHAQWGIASH